MRKFIAMAVLGASAALFSVATTAPAQAVTAGSGIAKSAAPAAESAVQEVRRRRYHRHRHYRGHRHYHRHRWHRHRHWHGRRYYRPYYYGGYYPYYRRPRLGIYFGI